MVQSCHVSVQERGVVNDVRTLQSWGALFLCPDDYCVCVALHDIVCRVYVGCASCLHDHYRIPYREIHVQLGWGQHCQERNSGVDGSSKGTGGAADMPAGIDG